MALYENIFVTFILAMGYKIKRKKNCWDCIHCESVDYILTSTKHLGLKKAWCKATDMFLFSPDTNNVIILSSEGFKRTISNTKLIVAKEIFDDLLK